MMNKNSNRKPFGDLTNKMSAVSLCDGIKPRNRKSQPEGSKTSRVDEKTRAKSPDVLATVSDERQQLGETKAGVRVRRKPDSTKSGTMGPSGDQLETITEESEVTTTVSTTSSLSSTASPFFPAPYHGASCPPVFLYPPPPPSLPPVQELLALVVEPGFISLRLSHGVVLDIANDLSVRLENPGQQSSVAMSGDSRHVAVIHPRARALLYQPRAEVQLEDRLSLKNAKFYSKGISFTASNLALVYLLDEAGARTTSDTFHDLLGTNIVEVLFRERCASQNNSVSGSCHQLDRMQYWRNQKNGVNFWVVDDLSVRQTNDGFVMVDRKNSDGSRTFISVSPSNGKLKASASLGEESHFFLRSGQKRLHYNGNSGDFVVRSSGQSAGFDEEGNLKIY